MSESNSRHSVSEWLSTVNAKHGEADTAWHQIWKRYAPRMRILARNQLPPGRKPLADEEDIVIEVFKEFFQGVQQGSFARLSNRDDLQQILIMLTLRRTIDAHRRNAVRTAHEVGESALPFADRSQSDGHPLDRVAGPDVPAGLSALACEELARLLDCLQDDTLRHVALMRVCSATDEEIAQELKLSVRTVQRKADLIAGRWRDAIHRESISRQDLAQLFRCWQEANDPSQTSP